MRMSLHSTRAWLVAALVTAELFVGRPAVSQVSARQGKQDPYAFRESMILEGPFLPANDKMRLGEWFSSTDYAELKKYTCDRINAIVEFRVKKAPENGNLPVQVRITLGSPDQNHDKSVDITLEVHNGDTVLATAMEKSIKVKEGARKSTDFKLMLPLSQLKGFDPMTQLRITVHTQDI